MRYKTISFADYIRQLPSPLVFDRFLRSREQGRRILSSSMLAEVVGSFSQPVCLRRQFESLSEVARRTCALAYLFHPRGVPVGRKVCDFDDELLGSFLVYTIRDQEGVLYYRAFMEFEPVLHKALAATLQSIGHTDHRRKVSPPWLGTVVNDLVVVLILAGQGELVRTKTGTLAKASFTKARKLLHCGKTLWKADFQQTVFVLLDFLMSRNLVAAVEREYREDFLAVERWLEGDIEEQYEDLYGFLMRSMPWQWTLAREMLAGDPTIWLSTAMFPSDTTSQARDALRIGECLGLIEVHRDGDQLTFAATGAGEHQSIEQPPGATITVLPDFTTIIPQEITPSSLYWFAKLGTLVSLDHVYKGRIAKENVQAALCAGGSGEELLGRLKAWRAPANVVETVREWIREFGRLAMCEESVVISADETTTKQLSSYEPLKGLITKVPSDAVFTVKPGAEKQIGEILTAMGFDPRMPGGGLRPAVPPHKEALVGEPGEEAEVVVEFDVVEPEENPMVRGGKYGSEMKSLNPADLIQVIEYAILMGQNLRVEYSGSGSTRKGTYTVTPRNCIRGREPTLEADDTGSGTSKEFLLANVQRIGVVDE